MQRFWQFLTNTRTLAVIGFAALAAFFFLGADALRIAAVWAAFAIALALLVYGAAWLIRRRRVRKSGDRLVTVLDMQADAPAAKPGDARQAEIEAVRKRMLEAIATIKKSKLGQMTGSDALYELPWYMVIGNPAAGKSTAIVNSGLQFPFASQNGSIVQGIGGTRNCDWFFTTDGILLDTAGRYSVHNEDRGEWLGFLSLLKKYRKRAPINGIIIAVSVAELLNSRPEFAIELARELRQRVHELTEKLEVFAPVYVLFTKADLITGFADFFLESERLEKDRVWGATMPYAPHHSSQAVLDFFDQQFDALYDGLKEISLASMSLNRGERMAPGVLTFPVEFASIKSALRSFIATLFEENPYQFKPVFRGFYLTSAVQEGAASSTSPERVANRFGLGLVPQERVPLASRHGFFLQKLFKNVIFADKNLVAGYASRTKTRVRYASFLGAAILLGASLSGWVWSYVGNQQLAANVQADLDQAIKLQDKRTDLQSRLAALEILQDRIEQLQQYRSSRPLSLGLGLYQGEALERKLREEYFAGVREIMVRPVTDSLEGFLADVNRNADKLTPADRAQPARVLLSAAAADTGAPGMRAYKDASPANVEDAYNALKTYLMLSDKTRAEPAHLNDQVTRFWRGWLEINRGTMPREQLIRSAERILSFSLAQLNDPFWPTIDGKLALIDQTRENLRHVVRGMPARERIYADIKARASTRYPDITVARVVGERDKDLVVGSYAIPGSFTRDAWKQYIQPAFHDAANKELQSTDWVLKTATKDDLTLEGSPEQIEKALVAQYKAEYAREWQKFVQGVGVTDLHTFDGAVVAMNRLGDPVTSPLDKIVNAVYDQTSWDNPSLVNEGLQRAQSGIIEWFRSRILQQAPSQVDVNVNISAAGAEIPVGPVGKEFSGVAKLVIAKDKDASLMRGYMAMLSKLRSRLNTIKNQGDPGPGAKQLMQQTLEGNGSELADALKYVDEQMMAGMPDEQKQAIRPLLVRPLMQAFAVIVQPTEAELNKTWQAQVYDPFQKTLAGKYPFAADARIEASSAEIGTIFGADGAIAKFVNTSMGPLTVRRGDALAPRTWADMGIALTPALVANFPRWVAPQGTGGAVAPAAAGSDPQTVFQIQPHPSPGVVEYTIEIDGQQLRYRNSQPQWTNFLWPNPQGVPGAKITATTNDGRTVEVANQPGRFGLERLINSANRKRKDGGIFELTWSAGGAAVAVDLRIISNPQATNTAAAGSKDDGGSGYKSLKLPETIVGGNGPTPLPAAAPVATSAEARPANDAEAAR